MAIAIATADGQLPNAKATLYTVPALTKAYIKGISLFNTGGGSETVRLYLNVAGTSRRMPQIVLAASEGADVGAFGLNAGDLIEGDTTTATTVDYCINIVEET